MFNLGSKKEQQTIEMLMFCFVSFCKPFSATHSFPSLLSQYDLEHSYNNSICIPICKMQTIFVFTFYIICLCILITEYCLSLSIYHALNLFWLNRFCFCFSFLIFQNTRFLKHHNRKFHWV